jgi:transposase InsO family protein
MADDKRTAKRKNRGKMTAMTYPYLLTLKDKFSRKCMLRACTDNTSSAAVERILEWIPANGIPEYFYSDGGPHFTSEVVDALLEALMMDRVLSVPYAPFTNGSAERVGRAVKEVLIALCSENQVPLEEWWRMLPLVELHLNSKPMAVLGGASPLQLHGTTPRKPIDVIVDGVKPEVKVYKTQSLTEEAMNKIVNGLSDLHDVAHEASETQLGKGRARANEKRERAIKSAGALQLQIGDWVMARKKKAGPSKLAPTWDGPHQGGATEGHHQVRIRDLLSNTERTEHTAHVARYRDGTVHPTRAMKRQVANDRHGFVVQRVDDYKFEHGRHMVRFVWRGFEEEDGSFNQHEELGHALQVLPNLTKRYVRKMLKSQVAAHRATGETLLKAGKLNRKVILETPVGEL